MSPDLLRSVAAGFGRVLCVLDAASVLQHLEHESRDKNRINRKESGVPQFQPTLDTRSNSTAFDHNDARYSSERSVSSAIL